MALVVFLRGMNVGGHRAFRPSVLAKALRAYDVVNIGAAGTFVVRNPGSRADFRAALLERLESEVTVAICDGRDIVRLTMGNPFRTRTSRPDVVRFVSVLSRPTRVPLSTPLVIPASGPWFVRVIASTNRFVVGEYRRQMKTIAYLGQLDELVGVPVTTRSWTTIETIVRILKE